MPATLSLSETVDLAQKVLDENKIIPSSGRAAPELSGRSVRWYTTAGIVDAPGREGHSATYGRRHLLQLLYTRQAQANGEALEKVREDIISLSAEDLVARVGLDLSSVPADLVDVPPRRDAAFWERTPTNSMTALMEPLTTLTASSSARSRRVSSSQLAKAARVGARPVSVEYVVRIGAVSVALDHEPTSSELISITKATEPLLNSLTENERSAATPASPTTTHRRK